MKTEVIFIRAERELKEQLAQAAKENDRSINAEALRRLRESFQGWKRI